VTSEKRGSYRGTFGLRGNGSGTCERRGSESGTCENRGNGSVTCEGEEVRLGHEKIEKVGNRACESRKLEWDIWIERKREWDM
jgi:hypothetical protein